MSIFDFRVRGTLSPSGRQRVYFSCHPDDFEVCFDEISALVLRQFDCTIWFSREASAEETEYCNGLFEMQLFIIPITANFLTKPNRARDFDLPYALRNHIPVLPLVQTPGLDKLFLKKCGDLQYIDKNACDATTLTYDQKITRFVSSVLIDDEQIEQIRKAFVGQIFLSYRKKDRAAANQLMCLIHDIPGFWDVSIWFDEYLTPGEQFNQAIACALQKSKIFVLCVTENLVNEDNYIRQIEYPKAREFSIPIVPVAARPFCALERNALTEQYHGIPECIDIHDHDNISKRLCASYTGFACRGKQDDPEHLYLIGLAYLGGIDVEIDHARAAGLIMQAAELGYIPAVEKLARMYSIGEGVAPDLDKAMEMYVKLNGLISDRGDDLQRYEMLHHALELMLEANSFTRQKYMSQIHDFTMDIVDIGLKIHPGTAELFRTFSLLAFVNEHDLDVFESFVKGSLGLIDDIPDDADKILEEKGMFYRRLASIYYENHSGLLTYIFSSNPIHRQRREKAVEYIYKSLELMKNLYEKDPIRWKAQYVDSLAEFCSMNYSYLICSGDSLIEYAELAIQLAQELVEEDSILHAARLASICLRYSEYLSIEVDISWEGMFETELNMEIEKRVPGMPEQNIPLSLVIPTEYDQYDIRRIRKTLALLRYSTALFGEYSANMHNDVWVNSSEAYFRLATFLDRTADCLDNTQVPEIDAIRSKLLMDAFVNYRKMLLELRNIAAYSEKKTDGNIRIKDHDSIIQAAHDDPNDENRAALEKMVYGVDPFENCHNFAITLSENDMEDESVQLHTDLYHFFKEVHYLFDPVLLLMNHCAYADSRVNNDETLSVLLEFQGYLQKKSVQRALEGEEILWSYYYKIARCYQIKEDFLDADRFFQLSKDAMGYVSSGTYARFHCLWARCKKDLGAINAAENVVLQGLEYLINLDSVPKHGWNQLCHEYASILIRKGDTKASAQWDCEMLI